MKILLINIRYQYIGGPERYLFNLKQLLELNHHEAIPFSVDYPSNEPTPYRQYFVKPLSSDRSVYYKEQKWTIKSFKRTLERNFYSAEVENNLDRLIKDTKPDFAIVLLYLRKLSPSVLVALSKNKLPFIVRLSDFGLICPGSNLFRNGSFCELCIRGNLVNSVRYRCVHGSLPASAVNYFATLYHKRKKYFDLVKYFVSPSRFLIRKMAEGGWDENRFVHLPSFVFPPEKSGSSKKTRQIIYSGRIEFIKGVHHLLEAIKILSQEGENSITLKIAGNSDEAYRDALLDYIRQNRLTGIEFAGNLNKQGLMKLLSESAFSVNTSLWYENLPNAVLESMACGTPVIAPDHGSFPEMVTDGNSGLLYRTNDVPDLARKIKQMLNNAELTRKMGDNARSFIDEFHSPEKHYRTLMTIIQRVTN
ncbi:MAG: glycosyltransferase family 4 protein [Bacteroidetes bacterium]|nr:glycosyltransferase family 4 protein [Bacteroidota bacterium]